MTGRTSIWIEAREIAQELEITVATFRKNVDRLIERDGFPLPSPHCLKPRKWRRQAFENWLGSQGYSLADLQATPPGQPPASNVHMLKLAGTA
ncbi:MAG: hypothetical protein AAFO97_15090 [Pseudomonadota bacterium]